MDNAFSPHIDIDLTPLGLTLREEICVREYLVDFQLGRACSVAALDPDHAMELVTSDAVVNYISESLHGHTVTLDQEFFQREYWRNLQLARQKGDIGGCNRALEMLGKLESTDVFTSVRSTIEVSGADEIIRRLQQGRERNRAARRALGDDSADEVSFW